VFLSEHGAESGNRFFARNKREAFARTIMLEK
jgi:hypothetical protein